MEEKNKNGAQGKPPRRRHGYFIQPPAQGANANADKPQAPKATASDQPADAKKQNHGEHKHNQNHHRNNKKPVKDAPKDVQPKTDAQKNEAPASAPVQEGTQQNQQKKKNNRNRNRNKRKSGAKKPDTQSVQTSNATPTEKAAPAPKSSRTVAARAPIDHSEDDYEEYKLVSDDENTPAEAKDEADVPRTEVVGIRFKSSGKVYYFDPNGKTYKKGTNAIVDTARGQEFGEVAMENSMVRTSDIVPPLREIKRAATPADLEHHKANKQKEQDAFKICNEKISAHKLDMKLIEAQYTFDNSKLLFYFTSSDRVDFRELVKDLASVFHTRIELRQIGIRDEAKLMGGLGMCGRPLCCNVFLNDFDQVSIKMAKEQNLSLNSAKISGICGRLMCCLKFEHEAYEYEIKRTPPVDSLVRTENGDGIVTEINPLRRTIKVRLLASPEVPPKTYNRDDVKMLRKKNPADKKSEK